MCSPILALCYFVAYLQSPLRLSLHFTRMAHQAFQRKRGETGMFTSPPLRALLNFLNHHPKQTNGYLHRFVASFWLLFGSFTFLSGISGTSAGRPPLRALPVHLKYHSLEANYYLVQVLRLLQTFLRALLCPATRVFALWYAVMILRWVPHVKVSGSAQGAHRRRCSNAVEIGMDGCVFASSTLDAQARCGPAHPVWACASGVLF